MIPEHEVLVIHDPVRVGEPLDVGRLDRLDADHCAHITRGKLPLTRATRPVVPSHLVATAGATRVSAQVAKRPAVIHAGVLDSRALRLRVSLDVAPLHEGEDEVEFGDVQRVKRRQGRTDRGAVGYANRGCSNSRQGIATDDVVHATHPIDHAAGVPRQDGTRLVDELGEFADRVIVSVHVDANGYDGVRERVGVARSILVRRGRVKRRVVPERQLLRVPVSSLQRPLLSEHCQLEVAFEGRHDSLVDPVIHQISDCTRPKSHLLLLAQHHCRA